jgi:hypothetical protein
MSISKNIKVRYLKRKKIASKKRTAQLKRPELFSKVLLVLNESGEALVREAKSAFPAAEIILLHERKEKEDQSSHGTYTVNASDFNLTGNLKSDKLNSLLHTEFDLIVDLSTDSVLLTFLIRHIKSSLVIGKMEHPNLALYDLFFDKSVTDNQFIQTIVKQLNQLIKK